MQTCQKTAIYAITGKSVPHIKISIYQQTSNTSNFLRHKNMYVTFSILLTTLHCFRHSIISSRKARKIYLNPTQMFKRVKCANRTMRVKHPEPTRGNWCTSNQHQQRTWRNNGQQPNLSTLQPKPHTYTCHHNTRQSSGANATILKNKQKTAWLQTSHPMCKLLY